MVDRYQSPEELNKAADELLKKHQDGELDEGFYDLGDEEEAPAATDEEGGEEEQPRDEDGKFKSKDKKPAKEPAKDDDDDEESDDDSKGSDDDEEDKDGDTDDESAFDSEGADEKSAKRIKDAQRAFHKKAGEAKRMKQWAQQVEQENKALRDRLERGKSPTNVPKPKVALSDERVKQLKEEYPDLADFFQSVQDTQIENAQLRDTVERGFKQVQTASSEQTFMGAIKSVHSDAEDIQQSDEWSGWLDTQPTYIQRAINEGATAKEVVDIISRFKDDVGWDSGADDEPSTRKGDKSGNEPAPSKSSKKEQARKAASPNLPNAARQHKPGKAKGETFSRAEIDRITNDPSKVEWLLSDEGEKWQRRVMKAMSEDRITD